MTVVKFTELEMAASPNDPRTKRRQMMGDDPNAMTVAPQPLPGAPQGQGNMMNNINNGESFGVQLASMSGDAEFPYGDMVLPMEDGRMGAIGFVGNSGNPQNLVPGQGYNRGLYNTQNQPDAQIASMMDGAYMMSQAEGVTEPGGLNNGQLPSYGITSLGMTGLPADVAATTPMPGGFAPNMTQQDPGTLPLQGFPDAQVATGMNTGRGGGRNRQNA